jgi:putative transport protein
VSETGVLFLAIGAAVLFGAVLSVVLLGHAVFRLSTDDLFGVVSGTTGNPAILVYANRALPSDRIDVAYASIFPSMTILKILCAQVAIGVLGGSGLP